MQCDDSKRHTLVQSQLVINFCCCRKDHRIRSYFPIHSLRHSHLHSDNHRRHLRQHLDRKSQIRKHLERRHCLWKYYRLLSKTQIPMIDKWATIDMHFKLSGRNSIYPTLKTRCRSILYCRYCSRPQRRRWQRHHGGTSVTDSTR